MASNTKPSNHIMVDLETMGNGNNSAIIAIGAVRFNEGGLGQTFYRAVDLQSSVDAGLEMDPSTVLWWLKQSEEARAEFITPGMALPLVLQELRAWMLSDPVVWGNGATFDNVILANAYRRCAMEVPWAFWNDKCYRTAKGMFPQVRMIRSGVQHNALADAMQQATHLIEIMKVVRNIGGVL